MIDLSAFLTFLANLTWSRDQAVAWAQQWARAKSFQFDHDLGAGESWARLLLANENVAFVHLTRPLIVTQPALEISARRADTAYLLSCDLSAKLFFADQISLDAAFPGSSSSPALAAPFSMEELWYATI